MERKTRGGRPTTRKPKQGDKVPMSLRLPRAVKLALQHQTARNGRSLSHEAEYRIERSFDRQNLCIEVMELRYGRPLAGLILAMGEAMSDALAMFGVYAANTTEASPIRYGAADYADEKWLTDPHVFDQVLDCAVAMMEKFRPEGDRSPSAAILDGKARSGVVVGDLASFVTKQLVEALEGRVTGENDLTRWAEQVQPLLADLPGPASRKR